MFNDQPYVNESQPYKKDETYKNESESVVGGEFDVVTQHRYTERLTKQDSIRLESDIRAWVPTTLQRRVIDGAPPALTLEEVCTVFHCKYNFARTRLKAMVQEGVLRSEGGQGSIKEQFYLATPEGSMNAEDSEEVSGNTHESQEGTKITCPDEEETQHEKTQSKGKDNNLSLAIEEIDKKIKRIQAKILRGEQKIQNLEISKKLLLEDESD